MHLYYPLSVFGNLFWLTLGTFDTASTTAGTQDAEYAVVPYVNLVCRHTRRDQELSLTGWP